MLRIWETLATIASFGFETRHPSWFIWKDKMFFLLDEYGLKAYTDNVVAVSSDANQLKEYRKKMARAKQL